MDSVSKGMDRSLDHGPNPPLFGLLPSSDDRPPAPLAATHYQGVICATAWSDSPNEASIGTLSWGAWCVALARFLDHGPNAPFFGLLPSSDKSPPAPLATTHYQEVMCVAGWSDSPNEASISTLSRGVVDTFYI